MLYQMLACPLQNKAVISTVRTIQRDWAQGKSEADWASALALRASPWQPLWEGVGPPGSEQGREHGGAAHLPPMQSTRQSPPCTGPQGALWSSAPLTDTLPSLLVSMSPGLRFYSIPCLCQVPCEGSQSGGALGDRSGSRCPGG